MEMFAHLFRITARLQREHDANYMLIMAPSPHLDELPQTVFYVKSKRIARDVAAQHNAVCCNFGA